MSKEYKTGQGESNKNTIIRGNNLNDSRMLGDLTKYRDIDFYKSHYTVSMNTVYEDREWVISVSYTHLLPATRKRVRSLTSL